MADRLEEITEEINEEEFKNQLRINLTGFKKSKNVPEYEKLKKLKEDYKIAKEKYDLYYLRNGNKVWYGLEPYHNHNPGAETHR